MTIEKTTTSLVRIGNSTYMRLPPDYLRFLDISDKQSQVNIAKDFSKYGRFVGVWNVNQKKQVKDMYEKLSDV